jgi:hypothetical protein
MGLLDEFSSFVKTPEGQGLLSAAFGGLATARRGEPINSMGKAGLAGLMGYGQAQDRIEKNASLDIQKQLHQEQIDKAKQDAADLAAQRTFSANVGQYYESPAQQALAGGGGPTNENAAKIPSFVPKFNVQGFTQGMLETPGMMPQAVNLIAAEQARKEAAQNNLEKIRESARLKAENDAIARAENAANREAMLRVANGMRQPVAPTVLTDNAGNVTLLDRSGNVIKKLEGVGKPSAGFEKAGAAKKKMTGDLNTAISELEKATADGGLIDKSTGSGAGAAVDAVAGFFGKATPGAIAVGQTAPIFDLVLKMVPRFEGPQSDKDTQSYKEAAGQIANPNTPNEIKKAAGREILRLMRQRKGQFIDKAIEGTDADMTLATGVNPITPKVATMADIQETARKSGKSTAEVTAAMKAQGYKIGGN